jgi:hypothetical protein
MNNQRLVTPDTNQYLLNRKEEVKREMNCISIGTIVAFDPTGDQTVTVQINYLRTIFGGTAVDSPATDQETNKLVSYPVLVKCPLVILTGGNSYLSFPVTVGDTCVILFNDRDIDTWWSTGSIGSAPNSTRVHDLNDALILVGVRSASKKIAVYNMNGPQLANGNALVAVESKVKIEVNSVTLGATMSSIMTQLISLANYVGDTGAAAALTTLQTTLNGIIS